MTLSSLTRNIHIFKYSTRTGRFSKRGELDEVRGLEIEVGIGREVLINIVYLYIIYILYININYSSQGMQKCSCPS